MLVQVCTCFQNINKLCMFNRRNLLNSHICFQQQNWDMDVDGII